MEVNHHYYPRGQELLEMVRREESGSFTSTGFSQESLDPLLT